MSEREKQILETIAKALMEMTEFEKGYFLGVAESQARRKTSQTQPGQQAG